MLTAPSLLIVDAGPAAPFCADQPAPVWQIEECVQEDTDSRRDLEGCIARVADGDQLALAELYDQLAPAVFGVARRVLRDPSQAEEVTQEVFTEVWRLATRFDAERGSVRTWATTIAHRRSVDR